MKATRNPHNLQPGQKLWYVPEDPRWEKTREVTVAKIGNRWAELGRKDFRADLETLEVDGGKYSSPGRCYLSREAWEEEKLLRAAWREFQRDVERANAEGGLITVENISAARQVLGLPKCSKEQKGNQ